MQANANPTADAMPFTGKRRITTRIDGETVFVQVAVVREPHASKAAQHDRCQEEG